MSMRLWGGVHVKQGEITESQPFRVGVQMEEGLDRWFFTCDKLSAMMAFEIALREARQR